MQLIQCTKKLADEMKIKVQKVDAADFNPLYCWHANLFKIGRKKCVMFMNNVTRYHFVVYGVLKKDLENLHLVFKKNLTTNLLLDGVDPEIIEQYLNQDSTVQYAATNNRSIISQINESIFAVDHYFYYELVEKKEEFIDLAAMNQWLNEQIMLKLPKYPVEMMREALIERE
ncbi:DUF6933 domain-containing protein [Bacillus sp. 123MFChir2]|uniref:DUF6933 domain-containing protein n=1 Tax=Bacillus sp. 123MFChir2 TaxID=1169144 RepID=UPI00036BEAFC|nr:hypothetical protein [Bacillus sp. 123MFChir2]